MDAEGAAVPEVELEKMEDEDEMGLGGLKGGEMERDESRSLG